jgi:nucleotide-binding universal stress UspA family protein
VEGISRVIVGASGSPGSLRALRYAEDLARAFDAILMPVHAWTPPGGDIADHRAPCGYLRRIWQAEAARQLQDAMTTAWGQSPAGLPVRTVVRRGEAGWVLVSTANCRGDLLVVGAGRRHTMTRIASGKVTRYCLAHATCPVLAVPPPALEQDIGHGLHGWVFWHRPLTAERVLQEHR